jgi:uncharacterized membrane protein YcaP (DUF421 family)
MEAIEEAFRQALGLGLLGDELTALQMGLRAVVVYAATVVIVRFGKKRFMGRATAVDVILGIMLGATASRAITGNAPFLPALAGAVVLVLMHWLLSAIAQRFPGFGWMVKGRSVVLVRNGEIDWEMMRRTHMSEHDLWQGLRNQGVSDLKRVAEARLERNGELSVIEAKADPKVVEIGVADGIKTVRIELVA